MRTHSDHEGPAEKRRADARRLRQIRGALYACTAVFFAGAIIWGAVLLKQGSAVPANTPATAVQQISEPGVPLAQPDGTAAPAKAGQTPGQTPDAPQTTDDVTVECMLSIPSLSLELPVTAYCTDEALLTSVCKFSGPQPGRTGNYVIVGHDFISGAQFAKLDKIQKGACVVLTDKEKQAYTYTVYAMELVTPEDTQSLATEPGSTEATLLTCAEENTKRLLVRCRME